MADVRAVKSGSWSDPTVWSTGALPTASDDVWANTYTVTIDTSPTVLSIRNGSTTGVTAGGFFVPTNGITLTCTGAGVAASNQGTTVFQSSLVTGQSCSINANCSGGSAANSFAVGNLSTGTLTITGNCTGASGGAGNTHGVFNSSTGILNIIGNCNGGTAAAAFGASNSGTGIMNITGNCISGSGTGSSGVANSTGTTNLTGNVTTPNGSNSATNSGSGTFNITGSVTGGASPRIGVINNSTGTINITGTITGGTGGGGNGAVNNSTGTINHIGTAQASADTPAIGAGTSVTQITILSGPLISSSTDQTSAAASGANPCVALRWFPQDTALGTFELRMRGQTVSGGARPARQFFFPDAYSATYPAASNVRSSTTYGPGSIYSGTCAVPGAASVLTGVPVDATTGTASNAFTAAGVRSAVGLSAANLDSQLSTLTTNTAPASIAAAVRTNLTSELARAAQVATTQEVAEMVEGAV